MKKTRLLVLILASAGLSATAFAQSTTGSATAAPATSAPRPAHAMRVDANGDGVITREEAAKFPRLATSFDQIDTSKDGKLSADEMKAWRMQQRGDRSGRRGSGEHRAMTPEMQARMQQQRMACFDKADTNHDGQLSRDEFAKLREACGSMMGHRDQRGQRGQRGQAGAPAPAAATPAQ